MRRSLIFAGIALCAPLAACGSSGDQTAASASTSTSSSAAVASAAAAATTTAPTEDAGAKGNCLKAGLAYSAVGSGLKSELDLDGTLRYAGDVTLSDATTQPGKDANVALAKVAYDISLAQAQLVSGGTVDRGTLQADYAGAQQACALVGGGL